MRALQIALFVPVYLALAACTGTLSDAAVERWFKGHVETQSEGRLRVVSFRKISGEKIELGGEYYFVEYEAQVEVVESGFWYRDPIVTRFKTWGADQGRDPTVFALGVPMTAGEVRTVSQTLEFVREEGHWRGPNGERL